MTSTETAAPPVLLDATMLLRWRHAAPVGVVRLERLLAARLRTSSRLPRAQYVVWSRGYRPADRAETEDLDTLLLSERALIEDNDEVHDADSGATSVRSRVRRIGLKTLGRAPEPLRPYAEQAAWSLATLAVESGRHVRRMRLNRRVSTPVTAYDERYRHRIEFPRGSDLVALGLGWEYMDHEALYRLRHDHDVHIHMPAFDMIPIVTPHLNAGQSHLVHRYYAEMAHYAETVTSISYATRDALHDFYESEDLPIPHLEVNQLPTLEIPERNDEPHRFREQPFVLSVSTIEVRKNHLLLAKIWAECIRDGRDMPRLVLVGRPGWDVSELYRWVEYAPELRDRVTICHDVDDDELMAMYRDCEFTLFPSRSEGWGLPISEALVHGKVCVHADDPAQFEASQHLMPSLHPDDFFAWKHEIVRLLDDTDYRNMLEQRLANDYSPRQPSEYVADFESLVCRRRDQRSCS